MRLFSIAPPRRGAASLASALTFSAVLVALNAPWPQRAKGDEIASVTAADAAGKTGVMRLTLTERSPLSAPADVAKRMHLKPSDAAAPDYDLSKESFYVYVPPEPGEGGKYGLMVGLCFKEYGFPPDAWVSVLDKYHLIWINPNNAGDNRPATQRGGLVLDATAAAQKLWPVDPDRVYFSSNGVQTAANGIAFYYSDVYDGMIQTISPSWFSRLQGFGNPPMIWEVNNMPRPSDQDWARAKAHSRFFLASRDEGPDSGSRKMVDTVYRRGYVQSGFKYVKSVFVPEAQMGHYKNYAADFFDEAVQFLDAPIPELKGKSHVPGGAASTRPAGGSATMASDAPATPPATAPAPASPEPPASPDEAAAKAASALSLAQNYVAAGAYDRARPRLRKIIQTYPGTPAAKEAEKTLHEIENK